MDGSFGEVLFTERELHNMVDCYAVAVKNPLEKPSGICQENNPGCVVCL